MRTKRNTVIISVLLALSLMVFVACKQDAIDAQGIRYGQYGNAWFHGSVIVDNDVSITDDLTVTDDTTLTDDVDIDGDLDVDGTANLDDLDVDASGEIEIDGGLTDFGGCTAGVADGDNDVCVAAVLEVDGELELDGTLDADSTSDFADTATFSKATGNAIVVSAGGTLSLPATADISALGYVAVGNGTPNGSVTAGTDEQLYVEGALEVDGEAEFDGTVDIDGVIVTAVNTENVGSLPTVISVPITWTVAAGGTGTVATIADGEIWFVSDIRVNVTTNFDCTGDDVTLDIGDDTDVDGLCVLADTELQAADTEGTGWAAGWQCQVAATRGVFIDGTGGFVYAPSGAAQTIDWILDETSGETITAGAATIYLTYTRIQ